MCADVADSVVFCCCCCFFGIEFEIENNSKKLELT